MKNDEFFKSHATVSFTLSAVVPIGNGTIAFGILNRNRLSYLSPKRVWHLVVGGDYNRRQ